MRDSLSYLDNLLLKGNTSQPHSEKHKDEVTMIFLIVSIIACFLKTTNNLKYSIYNLTLLC